MKTKLQLSVLGIGTACLLSLTTAAYAEENNKASRSTELNVEQTFKFENFRRITFDLYYQDEAGYNASGEVIRIYAVDADISTLDDERLAEKDLILMARTDADGRVYLPFELSHSITNIMIESNLPGTSGKRLVTINEQETISAYFSAYESPIIE